MTALKLLIAIILANTYILVKCLDHRIEKIIDVACEQGDLKSAYGLSTELCGVLSGEDEAFRAAALHIKSCLELITQGNYSAAVNYHQEAKAADKTVVPPLAALHLAEKTCGGISDIFFVSAVIIKEMANENKEATIQRIIPMTESRPTNPEFAQQLYDAFQTLVTLTFDSGLHEETDRLVNRAILMLSEGIDPSNQSYTDKQRLLAFRIRSALLSPAVFESFSHLNNTRHVLAHRVLSLAEDLKINAQTRRVHLARLDEFVVSPTFYFVYQGYKDRYFLEALHEVYSAAYPDLNDIHVSLEHKNPYNAKKGSQQNRKTQEVEPSSFVLDDLGGLSPEEMTQKLMHDKKKKEEKREKKREKKMLKQELQQLHSPLRVAFLSAHLRKHSICKLFCGLISGLARLPTRKGERVLSVYAFSALQENHEDEYTKALKASLQSKEHFVHVGKTVISNRREATKRQIDVLVFLDVGMDPSTMIWASARLAPLQICLWGHPTTTGSSHMDYFASSEGYHLDTERAYYEHSRVLSASSNQIMGTNASSTVIERRIHMTTEPKDTPPVPAYDAYTEQLLMFDSLGFHFRKPDHADALRHSETPLSELKSSNNTALQSLISSKSEHGTKLVLFPQHLPKLHPGLDEVFREILAKVPNSKLVLVFGASKKLQWKRTVERRWKESDSLGKGLLNERNEIGEPRIVWLDNLKSEEYLALLNAGDIMLDPFPFGGGVTTLESLSVCTPVLTLPAQQTVPALAAGMIRRWSASAGDADIADTLIATSSEDFIQKAVSLLSDDTANSVNKRNSVSPRLLALRESACTYADILFSSEESIQEWADMLWRLF